MRSKLFDTQIISQFLDGLLKEENDLACMQRIKNVENAPLIINTFRNQLAQKMSRGVPTRQRVKQGTSLQSWGQYFIGKYLVGARLALYTYAAPPQFIIYV